MANRYPTAAAFRQALEDRIRSEATKRGMTINDLRQKIVMERLLARLFASPTAPWLLKGGYAMDLRYRPMARATRDLDLTAAATEAQNKDARLAILREGLQDAASTDTGDYLIFRIGKPRGDLPGPPLGGARFPVVALLAGKDYARFHIDAGFGDPVIGEPERLDGDRFLDFADLPPAHALAIPKAQQFAEKVHAYTYPWTDRTNTRVKDLVDMVVLAERGTLAPEHVRAALAATFSARGTHLLPPTLPDAPASWNKEFAVLAKEAGLRENGVDSAIATLRTLWERYRLPG